MRSDILQPSTTCLYTLNGVAVLRAMAAWLQEHAYLCHAICEAAADFMIRPTKEQLLRSAICRTKNQLAKQKCSNKNADAHQQFSGCLNPNGTPLKAIWHPLKGSRHVSLSLEKQIMLCLLSQMEELWMAPMVTCKIYPEQTVLCELVSLILCPQPKVALWKHVWLS